jgi:hypothetical protein
MDARYQDYIYLIGQLKDIHKLHADVDHAHVHSFYKDKRLIFKLFYGTFESQKDPCIVISFHLDLKHHEAIHWFVEVYKIEASLVIHDSFIEDDAGETYVGGDAETIRDLKFSQEVLRDWLETSNRQQVESFTKSKVLGRTKTPNKSFDSQFGQKEAIIEFNKIKKPGDGEQFH